jgi:CBS domain-containing protein
MIETTVDAVRTEGARTVTPATPVPEAAEHLRDPAVSALPVVEEGDVVGMLTESDLVAMVAETDERPAVREIMSTPVTTVSPTATVHEAAERMRTAGVKHLPVVSDGVFGGLLSVEALAPYCSRHSVDVGWEGEPTRVDAAERGGVTAGD